MIEPHEQIIINLALHKSGHHICGDNQEVIIPLKHKNNNIKIKRQYIDEYKKILLDCISGDKTIFVSEEEVEAM